RDAPTVHVPENDTDLRQAKWLPRPAFVVEVFTRGTGGSGLLRQASFKALRPDKPVSALADAGGDRIEPAEEAAVAGRTGTRKGGTKGKPKAAKKAAKKTAKKSTMRTAKAAGCKAAATRKAAGTRSAASQAPRRPPELSSPEKVLF